MNTSYKILIVEDNSSTASALQSLLRLNNYQSILAADGIAAIQCLDSQPFDLILLDINIPEIDGFEILEYVRRYDQDLPIIIISARTDVSDRIRALDSDADDYITKPFDFGELLSRIRRRLRIPHITTFRLKDVVLDYLGLSLTAYSNTINLTYREATIMRLLIENYGSTVSRETLLNCIDAHGSLLTDRSIDVYISRLRKKLSFIDSQLSIRTKRQIGYTIE